tara:strand:+ start:2093 stop:2860 length:768 start_codon:yes stop_codon:yes gene_type:complete
MAIASNNSQEQVSGGGVPMYVGIAPSQIVAVNPTQAELADLGVNLKTAPEYKVTLSDKEYQKITFWVKHVGPDFITRFDILMMPTIRVSKDGSKSMWTNSRGQISWSDTDPSTKYDWYNGEGVRKAYVGEDTLLNFIKAWANVSNGGDCYLETIDKIVTGDVSELKQLIEALTENKVRLLMGVKDEKYQTIYTKHFGRLKPQRNDLFIKELNGDYGAFNAEYNADLVLRRWEPAVITPDAESASPVAASADQAPW